MTLAFAFLGGGFLIWAMLRASVLALRDRIEHLDARCDRVNGCIEAERAERGKLSKRLAQTESKLAKLQRSHNPPPHRHGI